MSPIAVLPNGRFPSTLDSQNADIWDKTVPEAPIIDLKQANLKPAADSKAFKNKSEEREYVKERLALALRIFGYLGYDEGEE